MAQPDSLPPEPGPDAGLDDIQADVERTRKELGDTVGALSAKLDVKGRLTAGVLCCGPDWDRTSDLPRVRRTLSP
jgi:Protein of unknown function (DUF3618)